jgi:hypothetical protein
MYISSRPATPRAQEPVSKHLNGGGWLLKLGQTIFVGLGVIGFVLLFQGR